ncbi:D-alanyl-D-alanine carboxypeptidase [Eubacteriales bacterium OttesenSCG-928-K08]|nr:D-alanyl-D-alanine carboxypeptidase [Eubacteriales bacterium OttesenSCG-928-K08]
MKKVKAVPLGIIKGLRPLDFSLSFLAPLFVLALLFVPLRAANALGPQVNASGAVLMDQATTRVLASQNAHERMPMASTTKVMTAMLAIENAPLNTIITVPKQGYAVEGSSMYLELGEKLTLEDLLYGLMLSSGNDAAVTIAMHIGGSVEGFARMMNNRALELGCLNTSFVTPNGLHDDNHYTTAYDLALICCAAMELPQFRQIVGTQYWTTKSGNITRSIKNKNKILWNYNGGNGIKTGFTKAAGKCLTFSAERGEGMVVGVVLNAPDMWKSATTLMDFGFDNHAWETIIKAGDTACTVNINKGMQSILEIVAKEDILIPLRQGETKQSANVRVDCPYSLEAPVYAGQQVGRLEVWMDERCVASTPIIAKETVYKKEYPYYLLRIIRDWVS